MSNVDKNILQDIYEKISQGSAQLLDVREQEEWNEFHFKKATLFPLSELKKNKIPPLNKNTTIYIHCRSGKRVLIAEQILKDNGFSNIIVLEKTLIQLHNAGFEVL